jgi:hypothetical protein
LVLQPDHLQQFLTGGRRVPGFAVPGGNSGTGVGVGVVGGMDTLAAPSVGGGAFGSVVAVVLGTRRASNGVRVGRNLSVIGVVLTGARGTLPNSIFFFQPRQRHLPATFCRHEAGTIL